MEGEMTMDDGLRDVLILFLDWYDPEASHRDTGIEGPVDDFLEEFKQLTG